MNENLYTIKDITFRIMRTESLLSCYFRISMISFYQIIINNNRKCTTYNFIVHHSHYLTFRKNTEQRFYLFVRPEYIAAISIDTAKRLGQLTIIFNMKKTDLNFTDILSIHKSFIFFKPLQSYSLNSCNVQNEQKNVCIPI